MRRRLRALLALPLALPAAGCAPSASSPAKPTLTVLAASSLAGVLDPLSATLRARHPGLTIRLVYAGSPSLVAQVRSGAPADVLITASAESLAPLANADLVGSPTTVAHNTVVLVVPAANPGRVDALADLAERGLRVALCDPSVPCGSAAQRTLDAARVVAAPDTLAPDVKTVLRLVTTGEADAGLVYASDARAAASRVQLVPLPPGSAASTAYRAAVVTASKQQDLGREYVALLTEPAGRATLLAAGFGLP